MSVRSGGCAGSGGDVEEAGGRRGETLTSTNHTADRAYQADTKHEPRVCCHDSHTQSAPVQGDGHTGGQCESGAEVGVGLVEIGTFHRVQRVARFAVEEHVGWREKRRR